MLKNMFIFKFMVSLIAIMSKGYPVHFNFTDDGFTTGNTISKNGLKLELDNEKMLDTDGGFIRLDKDNGIDLIGILTKGSSACSYSINTWVYMFE